MAARGTSATPRGFPRRTHVPSAPQGGRGKRGEQSRNTLAKIVRAMATGEIREYLELREKEFASMRSRMDAKGPDTELHMLVSGRGAGIRGAAAQGAHGLRTSLPTLPAAQREQDA